MSLNLTDEIFSRAARDPHVIAVIDAERTIDYRTLCRGVCQAARRFRQAGWKTGDIVGIALRDDQALQLVSSLALSLMGITQAFVPPGDPATLLPARIRRMGITGLVVDHGPVPPGVSVPTVTPEPEWLTTLSGSIAVDDVREPSEGRMSFIRETSGTTATPKLIGLTHQAEDAHRRSVATILSHLPGERFLNFSGLRFFSGLRHAYLCLSDGGTVALPPAGLDTDRMLRWIDAHEVHYILCVPLHLHYLLREIPDGGPRLPAVRILRSAAAALSVSAVQEVRKRISPNLYISYGMSEAGTVASATPAMLDTNPDTMGLPAPEVELEIVDDEDRPVACGVAGHIRIRGPGVISSYLGAVEPEQARMFRHGWFYPGDIVVRDGNGLLFHKGRSDEVMNFNGILVGPSELDSVLRQHPAVTDASAFALPSPEHGDIPAVAIVSSEPIDDAELRRFCAERLGARAPRVFVRVDAIPRNAMGKVSRERLTEVVVQRLRRRDGS